MPDQKVSDSAIPPLSEEDLPIEESSVTEDSDLLPEELIPNEDEEDETASSVIIDPALIFLIIVAVTLLGLNIYSVSVRYTILWTVLAVVGAIALIVDQVEVGRPRLRDLWIGVFYGALIGLPLLAIGSTQLQNVSLATFGKVDDAAVFQTLFFTMPIAETLYFRGAFQSARGLIFASAAASLWTMMLFFPNMNLREFPFVAIVLGLFFVFVNFMYGYLRQRFSLFTAWTCQIMMNVLLLFISRFPH